MPSLSPPASSSPSSLPWGLNGKVHHRTAAFLFSVISTLHSFKMIKPFLIPAACRSTDRHTHTASVSALIEHTPSKGENSSVYFISIVSIKISAICGYSCAWKTKVIIFVCLQTALTQEVFPRILSLSVRLPKISLSWKGGNTRERSTSEPLQSPSPSFCFGTRTIFSWPFSAFFHLHLLSPPGSIPPSFTAKPHRQLALKRLLLEKERCRPCPL